MQQTNNSLRFHLKNTKCRRLLIIIESLHTELMNRLLGHIFRLCISNDIYLIAFVLRLPAERSNKFRIVWEKGPVVPKSYKTCPVALLKDAV